jgi:hypothetical protein
MRSAPSALLAATLLAAAPDARACSVCACGDPLLAASDPAAIGGQLRLSLDVEALRVEAGTEGTPGSTDELTQVSYRANAVWRPVERFGLVVTVPVVTKTMRMVAPGMDMETSNVTGLGDVEVAGRLALWESSQPGLRRSSEVAVSLGSSLPTGQNDAQAAGARVDEHGQPGTGAWGPFAGLHYRFEQGDWLAFASLSGRVRTESARHYRYGSSLHWSLHGQWRPVRRLALDLGLDGRRAGVDREDGLTVENTGGTAMALAPAVYLNAAGGLWVFVRGQVPVYQSLFGEQKLGPTVVAGIQIQAI